MNKDKKITYIISLIIFAVLLTALFVNVKIPRVLTAILIAPLAFLTWFVIKKRRSLSINKREVLLVNAIIAVLYVIVKEMTGLYFGYYKNPYFINLQVLLRYIIPITVIVVSSEFIRTVLLAQKDKLVEIIAFISCVFADVLSFYNLVGIIQSFS